MSKAKLKEKITELEAELKAARNEIAKINDELWLRDNPPKYNKGDKFGELIVIKKAIKKPGCYAFLFDQKMIAITIKIVQKKESPEVLKEYFKNNYSPYWSYELVNTITGDTTTKKEIELKSLKNE